ncbi:hypothetical protein HA075_19835 [bacterium BFN5]|nr:hypothetical protein HA075_19810 [bacterium BFN5]QJW47803.1 hypothetical protein HA075_19835 [bacterium BFN5]
MKLKCWDFAGLDIILHYKTLVRADIARATAKRMEYDIAVDDDTVC